MDIAHWGLNVEDSGPLSVDGSQTKLPHIENGYNTPKYPIITYTYPGDVTLNVVAENEGVTFEGEKGRIFVNRGRIVGKAIEEQDADAKLKEQITEDVKKLFKGNTTKMGDHMGNFFEGFKHNLPVISDVESQHRTVSACHIGNISIRLGRSLKWDSRKEEFIGDSQANSMLRRDQREPYRFSV